MMFANFSFIISKKLPLLVLVVADVVVAADVIVDVLVVIGCTDVLDVEIIFVVANSENAVVAKAITVVRVAVGCDVKVVAGVVIVVNIIEVEAVIPVVKYGVVLDCVPDVAVAIVVVSILVVSTVEVIVEVVAELQELLISEAGNTSFFYKIASYTNM